MRRENVINLALVGANNLFAGISLSLLSPFYPGEALKKNVSVSQSGIVLGSVFITTIIFTPIVGRYIDLLGARKFLLLGSGVCAIGNVIFGLLDYVTNSSVFFGLSVLIRIIIAMGESAIPNSCMALGTKQLDEENQGKAIAVTEACFGLGTMFGPSLGGLLYDAGGFTFPFYIFGGAHIVLVLLSAFCITETDEVKYERLDGQEVVEVTWRRILTAPGVFISCFALCFAGTAWSWYSASLEPFLDETYGLSSSSTGLVFMCFGIAYTVFTPLFGFLSDRGLSGPAMLIIGNGFICLGMAFLGPIPPLQKLLGSHAWVTVVSISIQGLGSAASYLGTLTFMLQGCSMVGLPDNDKVKSMVSSLWVVSDCGGGYIGSTLGSIAYDRIGFQWATVMETGALAITVGVLIIYWIVQGCNKTEKQMEAETQVESQAEVGYQVERESRFEPELQADRVTGGVNTKGRDYGSTNESNQQLEV